MPWQDRLWRHIERSEGCWLWTGALNRYGYGRFAKDQQHTHGLAHRFVWELTHGAIPSEFCVLHRCDVRRCVNPSHLFLGTKTDNAADRDTKKRQARGTRQGLAKLTPEQVLDIRADYTGKRGDLTRLARQYGLSISGMFGVVKGLSWAHITQKEG